MENVGSYIMLNGTSDSALIEKVNYYISQGWQPLGGPLSTRNQHNEGVFVQAVVHPEKDKEKELLTLAKQLMK
jgi:hypothetical protein